MDIYTKFFKTQYSQWCTNTHTYASMDTTADARTSARADASANTNTSMSTDGSTDEHANNAKGHDDHAKTNMNAKGSNKNTNASTGAGADGIK